MPTIAITGGVASGKTAFRKYLSTQWNAKSFDADAAATELTDHSDEIRKQIEAVFGREAYREGRLDRERMSKLIFADFQYRKKLENILHPKIRERWRKLAEDCRQKSARLLVEIPLLYETGGETFCDFVVAVACPLETQLQRISKFRGTEHSVAEKIIASQTSVQEKLDRADQVIWNDGSEDLLRAQAKLTANYLSERYGQ